MAMKYICHIQIHDENIFEMGLNGEFELRELNGAHLLERYFTLVTCETLGHSGSGSYSDPLDLKYPNVRLIIAIEDSFQVFRMCDPC